MATTIKIEAQPVTGNVTQQEVVAKSTIPNYIANTVTTPVVSTNIPQPDLIFKVTGMDENAVPTRIRSRSEGSWAKLSDITIRAATYRRTITDSANIIEQFTRIVNYKRATTDTANVSEQFTKIVNYLRAAADQFSTQDNKTLTIKPVKISNVNANESIQKLVTPATKVSGINVLNPVALTSKLLKTSSSTATETFNRTVNYLRIFSDQIKTTDDYLGVANLDDDEYAFIGKSLADQINALENISKLVTKPTITDQFNVSSIKAIKVQLVKSSSAATAETLSRLVSYLRTPTDQANTTDPKAIKVQLVKSSSAATVETLSRAANYLRTLTDQASTSDTKTLSIGLFKSSNSTTTETLSRIANYLRTLTDQANVAESVLKTIKPSVTETINISVTRFFNTTIVKTSTVTTQESTVFNNSVIKSSRADTAETLLKSVYLQKLSDASAVDTPTLTPKLLKFSSSETTDSFTRVVNYLQTLVDQIKITDDYLGVANIDDDEYAFIGKSASDQINVLEILAKLVTKPAITDSISVSDPNAITPQLLKLSSAVTIETFSTLLNYLRVFTDTINLTDPLIRTVSYERTVIDQEIKYLVLENSLDYLLLETGDFLILDPVGTLAVESLGQANTQNYFVDGIYTTPGYTGTITTFTA